MGVDVVSFADTSHLMAPQGLYCWLFAGGAVRIEVSPKELCVHMTTDKRSIVRLPCAIALTSGGRSTTLGDITDISLDGLFVSTKQSLPERSVVPLAFELGKGGPMVRPSAEVVRVLSSGMGLRFTGLSKQDKRRLRRFITELANVVGNRASAQALLIGGESRSAEPFSDPVKIAALLRQAAGSGAFTIIPHGRTVREKARLTQVQDTHLTFSFEQAPDLLADEPVFVLYTVSFVSYSFEAKIARRDDLTVDINLPTLLSYSERRTRKREAQQAVTVSVALPWRQGERVTWPVLERSSDGLSFRASPQDVYFWPGTVLPELTLSGPEGTEIIRQSSVRHLSEVPAQDGQGGPWVKVGIGLNVSTGPAAESSAEELDDKKNKKTPLALRWGRDLMAKAAYLYHRKMTKLDAVDDAAAVKVINFKNTMGQDIVGLLNMSMPNQATAGRQSMPVVIVTPGFGARKETMAGLVATITENFRRNYKPVAVLRYDGTNSIGESYKDPGCDADGKESIHYTVSGGISDVTAATKWVKNNKFMEASDIIIVSVSFSSVAVRRALTTPDLATVRMWVSFMGAPDAQNAIMNVAGNVDGYGHHLQGIKLGTVALLGCLIDCDHFCADMKALQVANLDDARRDMKDIAAKVLWFVGKYDAFMDGARVREIMSVPAKASRKIIEVEAGHVPQSSDEAMAEFALMTRHMWRELYGQDLDAMMPSRGKLAAMMEKEWARVRRDGLSNQKDYWEKYLLGGQSGIGFDVWNLTPEYSQLLQDTVGLTPVRDRDVLDLGAGTGNLAVKLIELEPRSLTCADIVPAAVERLVKKLGKGAKVTGVVISADGSPRIALRRWMVGDIPSFAALLQRLPVVVRQALTPVVDKYDAALHAFLRGADLDASRLAQRLNISEVTMKSLSDFRLVVLVLKGLEESMSVKARVDVSFSEILDSHPGLPFADSSFDSVVSSLVLSYMSHVDDTLFEIRRILRPSGTFVASTLLPDTDQSKNFLGIIKHIETMPEEDLPEGQTREVVLQALREFVDAGSELLRLEEEGVFRFWSGAEFTDLIMQSGFFQPKLSLSFGRPPQGAILRCVR